MSFSFSSFGDEKKKKTRNNRHHRPFKPTRVSFQQSTSKRLSPPKIGPLILHEYATPSSKSFQARQYIAYLSIWNKIELNNFYLKCLWFQLIGLWTPKYTENNYTDATEASRISKPHATDKSVKIYQESFPDDIL